MSDKGLGTFEQAVLVGILDAGNEAFGVRVGEQIERRMRKSVAIGGLFVTLDRLLEKELITCREGDATPQRGGRPRKYYRVTAKGMAALDRARGTAERLWDVKIREVKRA